MATGLVSAPAAANVDDFDALSSFSMGAAAVEGIAAGIAHEVPSARRVSNPSGLPRRSLSASLSAIADVPVGVDGIGGGMSSLFMDSPYDRNMVDTPIPNGGEDEGGEGAGNGSGRGKDGAKASKLPVRRSRVGNAQPFGAEAASATSPSAKGASGRREEGGGGGEDAPFTWEGIRIGGAARPSVQEGGTGGESARVPIRGKPKAGGGPGGTDRGLVSHAPAIDSDMSTRLLAKDKEIDRLEALLLALEPPSGMSAAKLLDGNGDARDAKLLELAKRNRELSRVLAKETSRAGKALEEAGRWKAAQSAAIERERGMRERLERDKSGRPDGEGQPMADAGMGGGAGGAATWGLQVKQAQATSSKAVRDRDRACAEVRALHRIIRKEIGPDAHLGRLLASHGIVNSLVLGQEEGGEEGQSELRPSDWRGRAQVISLLRSRVKALERQCGIRQVVLVPGQGSAGGTDEAFVPLPPSGHGEGGGPSDAEFGVGDGYDEREVSLGVGNAGMPVQLRTAPSVPSFDVDDRAVATLAVRESTRARAVEDARAEVLSVRGERDKWKAEAAAARARAAVLDSELKKLRTHVRALLAKADMDDKLISGLQVEVEAGRMAVEKHRKSGAAAALLGINMGGSAFGGDDKDGSESLSARESSSLRREAEEARRSALAEGRTAAALRKSVRVLRDVLEANGIEPPVGTLHVVGGASSPTGGKAGGKIRAALLGKARQMREDEVLEESAAASGSQAWGYRSSPSPPPGRVAVSPHAPPPHRGRAYSTGDGHATGGQGSPDSGWAGPYGMVAGPLPLSRPVAVYSTGAMTGQGQQAGHRGHPAGGC